MTETLTESHNQTEQSEFINEPADFLSYWDIDVPQLIDQQAALGLTTKSSGELNRKSEAMKHDSRIFAPSMRKITDQLMNIDQKKQPGEYMDNVSKWYRSLGTTNNLEQAAPTLLTIYQNMKKSEVNPREVAERDLLCGELLHDLALSTTDPTDKNKLFAYAKHEYSNVLQTESKLPGKSSRDATKYMFDIAFEQLLDNRKNLALTPNEFEGKYLLLQRKQAQHFLGIIKTGVPTGELFEHYAVLMTRHVAWRDEVHDQTEVRFAMPREDEARYPWSSTHGLFWSYDMVVRTPKNDTLVQLKSEDMSHNLDISRYLPMIHVITNRSDNLRRSMESIVGAIYKAYDHLDQVVTTEGDDSAVEKASELFSSLV